MTRVVSQCQAIVPDELSETHFVSFHTLSEDPTLFARLRAYFAELIWNTP